MENNIPTIGFDDGDEIIFSQSFNIYNNKLIIPDFLGYKFIFIFEKTEPQKDQQDITISWLEKEVKITFSKKVRNSLGGGTKGKITVLKTGDGKQISFSIFAQQFSDEGYLHTTINFYRK